MTVENVEPKETVSEQEEKFFEIDGQQVKLDEIKNWRENSLKASDYEKSYNEKFQEVSRKEKEIEPLIELQKYLTQNPDKADQIASILEGKEIETPKPDNSDEPDPVKKEILELKKKLESYEQSTKNEKYQAEVEKVREFSRKRIEEATKTRPYINPKSLVAELLSLPDIHSYDLDKLGAKIDEIADLQDKAERQRIEMLHKKYIEEKKAVASKTKGEGEPGATPGTSKREVKVSLEDGSAKAEAMRLMETMLKGE